MNAWNQPNSTWWWTAPVHGQVKIGWERCIDFLPKEHREVNYSDLAIKISNGSKIVGKSGEKPDNLFGAEVHGAVIDEASRYREESFRALRTTLTRTKGPLKIIGNPKGKKNWFYLLCQKAKMETETEYSYYHLATIDNPFIDPKEIEDARQLLPKHVFDELYLGLAQDDSAGVFRNIRECADGWTSPWRGHTCFIGYDPARTQDNAALCVIEQPSKQVLHFEKLPRASWELQIERVVSIYNQYKRPVVWMDSTGLGDPLHEWLVKRNVQVMPFRFTNDSKQQLVENLAVDMEHKRIHYPNIPDLIAELDVFEYNVTQSGKVHYSAPEGFTDDCVIALALANWGATRGRVTAGIYV